MRGGRVVVGADGVVVVVVVAAAVVGGASVDVVVCWMVVVVDVSNDSDGVHADATSAIARTMSVLVVCVMAGAMPGRTMRRLLEPALVPTR